MQATTRARCSFGLGTMRGPVLAAVLIAAIGPGSAGASVPLTVDFNDGFTFSGVHERQRLSGFASRPLGTDFANVPTLWELIQQEARPATVRTVFPGQGGQMIQIDSGDPILFEYSAEGLPFQVRLAALGTPGFGGGLGNPIEFEAIASLQGSGSGIADITLPNLGFLQEVESVSFGGLEPQGLHDRLVGGTRRRAAPLPGQRRARRGRPLRAGPHDRGVRPQATLLLAGAALLRAFGRRGGLRSASRR